MSDMKDALRKAGLVSGKQVRRVQHTERVRRKELGEEGLEAERRRREADREAELERKKATDRARQEALEADREEESTRYRVETLLLESNLMGREAGPKRFYFEHPDGYIHFLDVSPPLARRLQMGDAAIVEAHGILSTDFVAIPGKAAHELERIERERILFWNIRR